jgi:hypothetical protein
MLITVLGLEGKMRPTDSVAVPWHVLAGRPSVGWIRPKPARPPARAP